MPADIRNFFGGKTSGTAQQEQGVVGNEQKHGTGGARRKQNRVVLDDSDDEAPIKAKAPTTKQLTVKKTVKDFPKAEETTTSDYFASSSQMKTSKPTLVSTRNKYESAFELNTAPKGESQVRPDIAASLETKDRTSRREASVKSHTGYKRDEEKAYMESDSGGEIFAADVRPNRGEYVESDSEESPKPKPKRTAIRARPRPRKLLDVQKEIDGEDSKDVNKQSKGVSASPARRKRKSPDSNDSEELEKLEPHVNEAKGTRSTQEPLPKKPRSKKEHVPENTEIQAIFDSIPTIKAPSPPPKDPSKTFNWKAAGSGNSAIPPAAGAKEFPTGADNCLAGLTFVFTGLLETISREQGQELVKRYGGRVTGSPSSKTDYVVLGSDAGPSKLEKIKAMSIKTINEDGLFELIRLLPEGGGSGRAAEKTIEKKKADEERIIREAAEMENEDRRLAVETENASRSAAAARGLPTGSVIFTKPPTTSQLWTTKYAPTKTNQICGNKGQVEKIQKWLQNWPKNRRRNFQLPGSDGSGKFRTVIIYGPPGIGKTTAAHLAAKLEGYDIIESNASDTRSKKLVESGLSDVLNNKSLMGFFAGDGKEVSKQMKKIVLIMDEVDGMSAGDRGGVGALARVCKKTEVPMILICNERKTPKMKPFDHVACDIQFRRPTVEQVRSRVATICVREGLRIPPQVMDALIEGSNTDIRQIINMLSTAKLDQTSMDFDQGKSMSKAWEKHIILKPWDLCHKLLGGGLFAPSSNATLNDKIELYFNDHEFSYLMIQENYLNTRPLLATNQSFSPLERKLKTLELVDKAAESISDGDLVDRMIHGSQQQWGLMPTHAVFSTVRPASFISGSMVGNTSFTQWLGHNSKFGKLGRYVKEMQSHMRLRSSGDRHEVRQQYLPVLWERLVHRLEVEGQDCIENIIKLMDSYFLTKDDFDYIMELGLGPQNQENVNTLPATKAAFTRLYNSNPHPMPFMKASNVVAPQKTPKSAPDLEEAIEEDDDDGDLFSNEPGEVEDEDVDITKDKYIKKAKAKRGKSQKLAPKKTGKGAESMVDSDKGEREGSKLKRSQTGKPHGRTTKSKPKN